MSVADELRRLGYRFEYERKDGDDRTEVWVNTVLGIAVRIEWMKVEGVTKGRDF